MIYNVFVGVGSSCLRYYFIEKPTVAVREQNGIVQVKGKTSDGRTVDILTRESIVIEEQP